MPKKNDFKLDVVQVRLVKDAPIYSEHSFNNPADIAAVMGDCMCQFDREVICVVNLRSDLKPINVHFATIILMAESKKELESVCETVETIGKRNSCTIDTHYLKQREALNTALPIGVRQVETMRTLLTQSLAVLMPFNVQELNDSTGNNACKLRVCCTLKAGKYG